MPSRQISRAVFGLLAAAAWLPVAAQAPASTGLRIVVVEGEGALNNIRERRGKEPVVRVVDAEFRRVAGASVTFLTTELGPSATFASGNTLTTTTDAKGEAVGRGLRPNNVAGPFEIRVTAAWRGQTAAAVVNQTNVAPVAARKGSGKKIAAVLIIVGGGATGATLALARRKQGASGTTTPPPGPATTITAGPGSFGKP